MKAALQIAVGSVMLFACAIWHIFALLELISLVEAWYGFGDTQPKSNFRMTAVVFFGIVLAHMVQIYFWAGVLWLVGAISTFGEAIYFSLVTYTTLGYGDVVLGKQFRIFGAMQAVTGLLMFGITTAFLVGYFGELIRIRQ